MDAKFSYAKAIIKEAGAYIRSRMAEDLTVEEKTDYTDLVTNIDKDTQNFLVSKISQVYPDDAIFGEENNLYHDIKDGKVWVLDPIDGTVNFIAQGCDFAVMIAYYEDGQGKFGLIYDVMADRLYSGGGEFPVTCNDRLLPSYQSKPLKRQLLGANGNMYATNYMGVADLASHLLGVRVLGSAGISMSRVLEGKLIGYVSSISPWDYAAASIMGQKLGYITKTLTGEPLDFKSRQPVMFIPQVESQVIEKYLRD